MASGKINLKGLEEYLEKVAKSGRDVDQAAGNAVLAGAEVARDGMRTRAPKDTHNLENHIQIKGPEQDGTKIFCEVGLIHDDAFTDAETARYGNAQEYGTATMPAQPYIRPTLDNDRSKIRAAERKSLEQDGIL
jgi:HK97 gp10 family phage protein